MSDGMTEMYRQEEKEKEEVRTNKEIDYYLRLGIAIEDLIEQVINKDLYEE